MDHIERMRITRLRAFVKGKKPFPCASRPGCTPTILARLAEYAAYLLAKREKELASEKRRQATLRQVQEAREARRKAKEAERKAKDAEQMAKNR